MSHIIPKITLFCLKRILVLFLVLLGVGALILLLGAFCSEFLNTTILAISRHSWPLRFIRWAMILGFFLHWPTFATWVGTRSNASNEQIVYWRAERMRLTVWLILFELIICENIMMKLIQAW